MKNKLFEQIFKDCLHESLGLSSFKYIIPVQPDKRFADFYFISVFNDQLLQTLLNRKAYVNDEMIQEVQSVIDNIKNKLYPSLKAELIKNLYFAIASEFRHIFDKNKIVDILNKAPPGIKNELSMYYNNRLDSKKKKNTDINIIRQDNYKDIINIFGDNNIEFIKTSKQFFKNLKWMKYQNENLYGGKKWIEACDTWINLYNAHDNNDIQVWIDHVFDLQHNTGNILDKTPEYNIQGYSWIHELLEFKKYVTHLSEYSSRISEYMIPLFNVLKRLFKGVLFR